MNNPPIFVCHVVPKSPLAVYTHSITVYTPRGRNESVNDRGSKRCLISLGIISARRACRRRVRKLLSAWGFRSPNAAEEHLKALARKGAIEIVSGASRGIRLLTEEEQGLPLIGRVAAGELLLAQQHIEGHYQVDPSMFKPNADFLLRVSGMSMKDIGILDGDLLAVHKTRGMCVTVRWLSRVSMKK